jgi:hypothetical protein
MKLSIRFIFNSLVYLQNWSKDIVRENWIIKNIWETQLIKKTYPFYCLVQFDLCSLKTYFYLLYFFFLSTIFFFRRYLPENWFHCRRHWYWNKVGKKDKYGSRLIRILIKMYRYCWKKKYCNNLWLHRIQFGLNKWMNEWLLDIHKIHLLFRSVSLFLLFIFISDGTRLHNCKLTKKERKRIKESCCNIQWKVCNLWSSLNLLCWCRRLEGNVQQTLSLNNLLSFYVQGLRGNLSVCICVVYFSTLQIGSQVDAL